MKSKANFKLSKESKMIIATVDPKSRKGFTRLMVQAEIAAAVRPKTSKANRNTPDLER